MSKRATDVTQFHSVDRAEDSGFLIGALVRIPANPYTQSGVFVHRCRRPRSGRR
jgi:hypothetical protein